MMWIDAKERLPPENTEVLLLDSLDHSITIGCLYYDDCFGNNKLRYKGEECLSCSCEEWWEMKDISHWMPLPELPE